MSNRLHASRGRRHQSSRDWLSPCKKGGHIGTLEFPFFQNTNRRSTCLEVLWTVGGLVSKLPDRMSGSEYPCSTKRAFAFALSFPSSAHLRTKRALRTRPSDAFSGSSSSCHTPFSKIDCSSAFFAVVKVRRSSTVMRGFFQISLVVFLSLQRASCSHPLDLWIFFFGLMYGILSFKAASLLRGNKVLPKKASLEILPSAAATGSTIIAAAPSRKVIL